MSLFNLAKSYERMQALHDADRVLIRMGWDHAAGLQDYLCAFFLEKNVAAGEWLVSEAEKWKPRLESRRKAGKAEA